LQELYIVSEMFLSLSGIYTLKFLFFFQKYIEKQIAERKKKLHEDRLLKERAVKEKKKKLEVPLLNITATLIVKLRKFSFCLFKQ